MLDHLGQRLQPLVYVPVHRCRIDLLPSFANFTYHGINLRQLVDGRVELAVDLHDDGGRFQQLVVGMLVLVPSFTTLDSLILAASRTRSTTIKSYGILLDYIL